MEENGGLVLWVEAGWEKEVGRGDVYFCSWCLSLRTIVDDLMMVSRIDCERALSRDSVVQ